MPLLESVLLKIPFSQPFRAFLNELYHLPIVFII
jgi:hypothetical protein